MINVDGGAMMAPDSEFGKGFTVLNTKNDNYGKILWTGSSFFLPPLRMSLIAVITRY